MIIMTTYSVAESLTGGCVQAMLTGQDGSSKHFMGGICAYTTHIKEAVLGIKDVPVDVDDKDLAHQMALACKTMFQSNVAISTTGYIDKAFSYCLLVHLDPSSLAATSQHGHYVFTPAELQLSRSERQRQASLVVLRAVYRATCDPFIKSILA